MAPENSVKGPGSSHGSRAPSFSRSLAQRVGSILHLSEAELMEITHFERGSALISTNNNNVAVEIKCSELEKELITTDRRELQELLKRNSKTERA